MANYALEGPRWGGSSPVVTWTFDATVPASFESEIAGAFKLWSDVADIGFQRVANGSPAGITFTLGPLDGAGGTLGLANYAFSNGIITSARITFDTAEGWRASGSNVVTAGGTDISLIAAHEIGHAIGLDHYNAEPAVMNAVLTPQVTGLTGSDIAGVRALYPAESSLQAVYRFFERTTGEHFYTTSAVEKDSIERSLPNFTFEGAQWAAPQAASDTQDVFRFYQTTTNTHFYTTSVVERDAIVRTLPNYRYEGVAFQAYKDDAHPSGEVVLERFFNTATGLHHFALPGEADGIRQGSAGPGWVDEGPGLRVHAITAELLV